MKRYIYIFIGLAVFFTIYYLLQKTPDKTVKDEAPAPEAVSSTDENGIPSEDIKEAGPEETKIELRPSEIFSDSASGRSISKVVDLYGDLDAPDTPSGKEAHAELQKLYDTPNQAFEEIKRSVLMLPSSMELQKQFFLQFSSLLKVEKNDKLNFLDKAFKSTISKSSSSVDLQVRKTPVIVFETYCNTAENKELCLSLLNGSIGSAPKDVQIPLLNVYKKVDAEGAKELANKLEINIY